MSILTVKAKVKSLGPIVSDISKKGTPYSTQELILEEKDLRYSTLLHITAFNDEINHISHLTEGMLVEASLWVQSSRWESNGKSGYNTNLNPLDKVIILAYPQPHPQPQVQAPQPQPQPAPQPQPQSPLESYSFAPSDHHFNDFNNM